MAKKQKQTNKKRKILLSTLIPVGVAAIAAGVTIPLVLKNNNKQSGREIEIDPEVTDATFTSKTVADGIEITVTSKDPTKAVEKIAKVMIGEQVLVEDTDYRINKSTGEIIVLKVALDKYQGKIRVTPVMKTVDGIAVTAEESTVYIGSDIKVHADLTFSSNSNEITWENSDPEVARLEKTKSSSGESLTLTGLSEGSVTLTASCNGKSDSTTITVEKPTIITKIEAGTDIKSTFTSVKINSTEVSQSQPYISFTVDTVGKTADVEGHFVIYKTKGTPLAETVKQKISKGTEPFERTLQITDWTSLTSEDTLTVDWVDESVVSTITVSGSHNVDINNAETLEFTATDNYGNDVTSKCTFNSSDPSVAYFKAKENTLTLADAKTKGGSLTITATYTPTDGNEITDDIDIEIATFNQLDTTGGDYSLQKGIASDIESSSGYIVIPSRYWNEALTTADKWVTIHDIPANGMNANAITGLYIGKNIVLIGSQAFGKGLKTLAVDSNNTIYQSPTDSNCIVKKTATDTIVFGCAGTDLTKATSVTKIGDTSFYNTGIETLSIPATITSIGSCAFQFCSALTTVEFLDTPTITSIGAQAFCGCTALTSITIPASVTTIGKECFKGCGNTFASATFAGSNKWIQTDDSEKKQLNVSTASTNATNLKETSTSAENNWGYTGITVDSSATKYVNLLEDTSVVTYFTNFSGDRLTLVQDTANSLTITCTAAAEITGSFVLKDGDTEVIRSTSQTFKTSSQTLTITLDATAWGKVAATGDTLKITFKEAAKTATVSVDSSVSTSFGTVTITSGASLTQDTTDTVVLSCTAATADILGKMVLSNTAGTVIESAITEFTASTAKDVSITLDSTAWGKVTSGDTLTVTFTESTAKDQFGEAFDKLLNNYVKSTATYQQSALSDFSVTSAGVRTTPTIDSFEYTDPRWDRDRAKISYDSGKYAYISINTFLKWVGVKDDFAPTSAGGSYVVNDDGSIEYTYTGTEYTNTKLVVNKWGYVTSFYYLVRGTTTTSYGYSLTITGDPA